MSVIPNAKTVEIRVERFTQLFDNHDPFPFMERNLDPVAEAYILSHTENLSARQPIHLVVHLPQQEAVSPAASQLETAISRHFSIRADALQRSLSGLFRIGRRSLLIGLAGLAVSLMAVKFADNLPGARFPKLFAEGLTIFGWVANWRPMEIFLYDWWPIAPATEYISAACEGEGEGVGKGCWMMHYFGSSPGKAHLRPFCHLLAVSRYHSE